MRRRRRRGWQPRGDRILTGYLVPRPMTEMWRRLSDRRYQQWLARQEVV